MDNVGFKVYQVIKSRRPIIKGSIALYFKKYASTKKSRVKNYSGLSVFKRGRLPTLPHNCSTIGVGGLNFSVRNGKRWIPNAITTLISLILYIKT